MDSTVPRGCVAGVVVPPCSKSYAQRALAASLLARGESLLENIEFCNDTRSAIRCIEALGAKVRQTGPSSLTVTGGLSPVSDTLYVGESGLSTRLFTPIASLCNIPITVRGEGTLLKRSMKMMIDPLRSVGVEVQDNDGYIPLTVRGPIHGGEIEVDGSVSSQFVTGLLLALPLSENDTVVKVKDAVSKPYIDMTIDTAAKFGVKILHNDYTEFYIEGGQTYEPTTYAIEGDWSAAAMLLVAGAVAGQLTLKNISMLSKQADVAICDALVKCGASLVSDANSISVAKRELHAFTFDATNCPDLFPALAVLAAASEGESVIVGTNRLLGKESNRAESIAAEYRKLGIEVDIDTDNVMKIKGGSIRGGVEVDSWNDHRIAMSLAVSALRSDSEVTILNSECVAKSYPGFFSVLSDIVTE